MAREGVTERSFYAPLAKVLESFGIRVGSEIKIEYEGRKFSDLEIFINGEKSIVEVKIDGPQKLIEALTDAFQKAEKVGASGSIALLLPPLVRQLPPESLSDIAPNIRISQAIAVLPWYKKKLVNITFLEFAKTLKEAYLHYIKTREVTVSFDLLVETARECVEELAISLRRHLLGETKLLDMALQIIGRFDIYKSMLQEFEVPEEEMKAWIADIMAYTFVNQLLFYHIIAKKRGLAELPPVNPLEPTYRLYDELLTLFESVVSNYPRILGLAPHVCQILKKIKSKAVLILIAKFINIIKRLEPEHVKEELLGRLYQESIPPETRKNLGAFYTNPIAAKLLANLAIDEYDEKVIDPACGSGTLLVESYWAKMKKAPINIPRDKLHNKFLLEDIVGIDVMHFAMHMTSINLAAQNLLAEIEPRVYAGDGIEAMVTAKKGDDPPVTTIRDWLDHIRPVELLQEHFDVVIMNPPFTRRERIPEKERPKLESWFKNIIRGKVGYWAYFVAAADYLLKVGGKLALVTPEEFFAGKWAESLRRYLFCGEVYDEKTKSYVKKLDRIYFPRYIVKSSVEIAFSEGARYRDYLMVLEKCHQEQSQKNELIFIILKKPLHELGDKVEQIVEEIKRFERSTRKTIYSDCFDAIKVANVLAFIEAHINNLKPLVGLNSIKAQELVFHLLEKLSSMPTLRDLENEGRIKITDYNPGQYKTKGVEDEARKLFISRYKGRGKIVFYLREEKEDEILVSVGDSKPFTIKKNYLVPSLRTYSGVSTIDISGVEEYAIIDVRAVPTEQLNLAGLVNRVNVTRACQDLKQAFDDLAGNLILVRRARLTSNNLFWLTFFSSRRTLVPSAPLINVRTENERVAKLLAISLNSSLSLLQLLGFVVETEGAWVAIHGDQVWENIHVPNFWKLKDELWKEILASFDEIGKIEAKPLLSRMREKDALQRKIDLITLKMFGLEQDLEDLLDNIYEAIVEELEILKKLAYPEKKTKKAKENRKKSIPQMSLEKFVTRA